MELIFIIHLEDRVINAALKSKFDYFPPVNVTTYDHTFHKLVLCSKFDINAMPTMFHSLFCKRVFNILFTVLNTFRTAITDFFHRIKETETIKLLKSRCSD